MNHSSEKVAPASGAPAADSPILLVPYMWIGDFVRCHSVVKLLRARWPDRPVDLLTSGLCAPLLDYMPGVRKGIVSDLPRRRLPLGQYRALADTLRAERYGTALIMLRTWKSALAPFLAGIPERVGFAGEARFGLLSDLRFGERKLERMIDRMGALAFPKGADLPVQWPLPELVVPKAESDAWLARRGLKKTQRPVVTLAPGAVGPGKAWPPAHYAELARQLAVDGVDIWVLGGPNEKAIAAEIAASDPNAKDLTGQRFARCDHRHDGRGRRGHQRFRLDAHCGRAQHADHRDFRADEPAALVSAQSAGGGDRAARRTGPREKHQTAPDRGYRSATRRGGCA